MDSISVTPGLIPVEANLSHAVAVVTSGRMGQDSPSKESRWACKGAVNIWGGPCISGAVTWVR